MKIFTNTIKEMKTPNTLVKVIYCLRLICSIPNKRLILPKNGWEILLENRAKRKDRSMFVVKPISSKRSPLDVAGVNVNLSAKEIVDIVREVRER